MNQIDYVPLKTVLESIDPARRKRVVAESERLHAEYLTLQQQITATALTRTEM